MAKYTVYVTDDRHPDYDIERRILQEASAELRICNCLTEGDVIKYCSDADGLLLNLAPAGAEAIKGLKHCKIINRYGVGYDNVDVEACTAQGIQLTFVPDYCAEDVSDHALALLLSCLRHVALRDRRIREGQWNIQKTSFRLKGKTLGILGFGRIAQALARKTSGFGLEKILVYDPYVSETTCAEAGVIKADIKTVMTEADFLSLHMPVTSETKEMINSETLSWMKTTAIIINTARGQLVNDASLIDALKNHKLLAAGLDTYSTEPLSLTTEYRELDNVILTDHTAYSTTEGLIELKTKSARNVADALMGKPPVYPVNHI